MNLLATLAYMGAGADLGLISAAIGLLLTLGSSFFFLLLWPLRVFLRKLRLTRARPSETADSEAEATTSIPAQSSPDHRKAA
jgi:hypothetical protein